MEINIKGGITSYAASDFNDARKFMTNSGLSRSKKGGWAGTSRKGRITREGEVWIAQSWETIDEASISRNYTIVNGVSI
jgi:hypothetical protein